jgi:hypothetical protein
MTFAARSQELWDSFTKPTLRNFTPRGRLECVVLVRVVQMEKIMPDQTFVLVTEDEDLVRFIIVQALLDEGFGKSKPSTPKLP